MAKTPRTIDHSYPSTLDMFCGAGGSSQGAAAAGAEIKLALNHSKLAISTHAANFPHALHDCCDISATDPRRYPSMSILIASPECDWHTNSQGQKRYMYEENLFGEPLNTDAGERSRATAFDVIRFAEHHRPRFIVVENVWEFRKWRLYEDWRRMLGTLGYDGRDLYLNSMIAHPTPQSRDRFYFVAWRKGTPAPDLEFRPKAPCIDCGAVVEAVQSFKNPGKPYGRFGARNQYLYICPACGGSVYPFYYPAYSALDFSIPAPIIGERKRPLAPNTMERIRAGLKKFADSHVLIETAQTGNGDTRAYPVAWRLPTQTSAQSLAMISVPFRGFVPHPGSIVDPRLVVNRTHHNGTAPDEPLSVFSSGGNHGLVVPFLTAHRGGTIDDKNRALTAPQGTHTAANPYSLTVPPGFVASYYGAQSDAALADALDTVTTKDRHALVTAPIVVRFHENQTADSGGDPLGTIAAGGRHHGLLNVPIVQGRYQQDDRNHSASELLRTLTSVNHHHLIDVPIVYGQYNGPSRNAFHSAAEPQNTLTGTTMHQLLERRAAVEAEECGFRMLTPEEIQRGMAFDDAYIVNGTKAQRVEQLGNAVTPPIMQMIIERCLAVW